MQGTTTIRIDDFDYLDVGGVTLSATLYRPPGSGFPAVIDVHGGRWINNDRFNNREIAVHLAQNGIAVLSIDFRMPPEAGYPSSVHDIHYGVRWLKLNAARFGIRSDAIGGLGTSSGGHQLLLTALIPDGEPYGQHKLKKAASPNIDASIPFLIVGWPVSDPVARFVYAEQHRLTDLIDAHKQYWKPLSLMGNGNPKKILETGAFTSLPSLLLIQGKADENFDYRMNEAFVDAYRRVGGSADLVLYDDEPHAFMTRNSRSAASQDALCRICTFIHNQRT